MRYTRTLRTFSFFLLLLSAVLAMEEQASRNQRSNEGISEGQSAGGMDDTVWRQEDAADKEGSCDADDCVDLGTRNVNLEPDQILKLSDPDTVFDMPRAARQNAMETDPIGTAKRTEFGKNEDRPSPDKTVLPTLKSTEPPTASHRAETSANTREGKPEEAQPTYVSSTASEDDVAVKPPSTASESKAEAPAVRSTSAEPQAAQTDGPGPLYPTPQSTEATIPRQEKTDASIKDERDSLGRTVEQESELVDSKPDRSLSLDRSELSGSTQEKLYETTESKVMMDKSEPPSPIHESTTQSLKATTREFSTTAAGISSPSKTPEAVSEPERPQQSLADSLTPTPTQEPAPEESEPTAQPEEGEPTAQLEESEPTAQPEEGEPTAQPEEGEPTAQPEEGEPTAQLEEGEPTAQPEESEPTTQPEEGEPTTQPETTFDFEPEEQLSLNDSDTTQEGTIGGSQTPTAIPRRRLPQEPIRVGLPRVEGEAEKEEVVEEEDSEAFEQVRPVKVTFVPDLSPKSLKPYRLDNSSWFIMFYAPWCLHSQAALPVFLDIFQYIVDHNISVYIGKLDVSKYGEALKQFRVKATPTFLFYRNTIRYELVNDVSFENLKNFMNTVLTAEVTRVNTSRQLSELRTVHPVLFLLIHDREEDSDWHTIYTKVATDKALKGKFCYTTEPDIVEDLGVSRSPAIVVIKNGKAYRFAESLSAYALSRWVASERYEEFPTANATTLRQFIKSSGGRRLAVLAVHDDPAQRRIAQKKAIEVVKKVALSRKLHSLYQFVLLESIEMAERMQQGSVELPALYAYEIHTGYYYLYEPGEGEKGMTEESVITFFKDVSKNKIEHRGGPSYINTFKMWWWWLYGTFHTTITHRPTISAVALFSVVGVVIFYLTICCRRSPKKLRRPLKGRRLQASSRQQPRQNAMNSSGRARKRKHNQLDEGSEPSGSESQSHSEAESPKDK